MQQQNLTSSLDFLLFGILFGAVLDSDGVFLSAWSGFEEISLEAQNFQSTIQWNKS